MYLNRQVTSLKEAKEKLAKITLTPQEILLPIEEALGLTLAKTIKAPFSYPAFRRSGYDGYGILAVDDEAFPKKFTVVGEVGAGSVLKAPLKAGETVRIMTGAKVPDEVAKVIMLEQTEKSNEKQVTILTSSKNSNISKVGEEFLAGDILLKKGTCLNAGGISLLAAFGYHECWVLKKPKVGILTTGSELLTPGKALEPGKIYNSNGPLLAALVKENGGEVAFIKSIPDELTKTREEMAWGVENCDLLLTTGGVSVGDFDYVAQIAHEGTLLFNKLSMRPGSPTTAFIYHDKLVLALSGNPGACFTNFYLLVEPLLQKLQGQASKLVYQKAPLTHAYDKTNQYDKYLRGTFSTEGVSLIGSDKSSALGNLPEVTCLFKIPREKKVQAGQEVEVWHLPYK